MIRVLSVREARALIETHPVDPLEVPLAGVCFEDFGRRYRVLIDPDGAPALYDVTDALPEEAEEETLVAWTWAHKREEYVGPGLAVALGALAALALRGKA